MPSDGRSLQVQLLLASIIAGVLTNVGTLCIVGLIVATVKVSRLQARPSTTVVLFIYWRELTLYAGRADIHLGSDVPRVLSVDRCRVDRLGAEPVRIRARLGGVRPSRASRYRVMSVTAAKCFSQRPSSSASFRLERRHNTFISSFAATTSAREMRPPFCGSVTLRCRSFSSSSLRWSHASTLPLWMSGNDTKGARATNRRRT